MKPILFSASETAFTSNGLGRLDPTKCVVVEERNGLYELECVVPVDSPHFDDIANNMILGVIPGDGMTLQAFRIYQITEPLNGLVTLSARHLSYDLSYNSVMPFTAASINAAFLGLVTNSVETNPFTMWTDKTTAANFKVSVPQTFRSLLGGQQGSILDVYGGEYEFDNWTVKLWNHRGSDTDVTLRYGKNITDINQEQNLESVVTGLVPYWADENDLVTLPEKSVDSSYASSYPYKRTVPIDFSSEYENKPTESQLRTKTENYILANDIGVPKVSIKVSFVALWQTEEYKNVAPLERVHLCDTVGVVFEKYGINTRAKVIRTEWDCLSERYLSIELGEARSNFAKTIVDMNDQTQTEIDDAKTFLEKAIDTATALITGNNGGYLKINANADGQPYELLIMDTDDVTTATKVWRWNMGGLGYSSTGYTGTFGTAITMNGQIVADYIATGDLDAARIRAGILQDLAGKFSLDMTTGALTMNEGTFKGTVQGGTIKGGTIGIGGANNDEFSVDSTGSITIKKGTINLGWDSGNNRYKYVLDNTGHLIIRGNTAKQYVDIDSGVLVARGLYGHTAMQNGYVYFGCDDSQGISSIVGNIRPYRDSDSKYGIYIADPNVQKYLKIDNVNGLLIAGGLEISTGGLTVDSGNTLAVAGTLNVTGTLSVNGSSGISNSYDIVCNDQSVGQVTRRFTFTKGILTSVVDV